MQPVIDRVRLGTDPSMPDLVFTLPRTLKHPIKVSPNTAAGDGWCTFNAWLDSYGDFTIRGRTPEALGRAVADCVRLGMKVTVELDSDTLVGEVRP